MALLQLLQESLQRVYWRVACRRYLMLQACGEVMSPELSAACVHLLKRCSAAEVQRMRDSAQEWAGMCSLQQVQPGVSSASPRVDNAGTRSALPSAPRTQWRPVPAWFSAAVRS